MTHFDLRCTAITIIVYVIVLFGGFMTLAVVFGFPDILRASVEQRLSLFTEKQSIIAPTYYLLALTGVLQIVFSIGLGHLADQKSLLMRLATYFGVLCGVFQLLGFIRWPVLIPYIADLHTSEPVIAATMEGAFNHYLGMTVGEHLGFLMQALWMMCLGAALLSQPLLSRVLSWSAIVIGVMLIPVSIEPLSPRFATLGELASPIIRTQLMWLCLVAISLFQTSPETLKGPTFTLKTSLIATGLFIFLSLPSLLR